MASGIRDKVAIVGMGCSRFGERWDAAPEDLMLEACDRGARGRRDRARSHRGRVARRVLPGAEHVGKSGLPLSMALRLPNVPVTRVENLCATGTEALRGAVYAVAAGAVDIALADGRRETQGHGLRAACRSAPRAPSRTSGSRASRAPGAFAQLASAYAARHGHSMHGPQARDGARVLEEPRERQRAIRRRTCATAITHRPGARTRRRSPTRSGVYDCCGVSDGAACAIVTTPAIARELGKRDMVTIKALQLAPSNGVELGHATGMAATRSPRASRRSARTAKPASRDPRARDRPDGSARLLLHHRARADGGPRVCPSRGRAVHDVLDGRYDRDGRIPCQVDGGLKCFGHPIGASGLRMAYEIYLQLLGRAGERQLGLADAGADAQSRRHSQSQRRERRGVRSRRRLILRGTDAMERKKVPASPPPTEAAARLGIHGRGTRRRHPTVFRDGPARGQGVPRLRRRLRHRPRHHVPARAPRSGRHDLRPPRRKARRDRRRHRAALGRKIATSAMTIRDPEQVDALIAETWERFGRLDAW